MFQGNVDGDEIRRNNFDVPIIAQWIRINPTRWQDRISLRLELYGCDYGKFMIFFRSFSACTTILDRVQLHRPRLAGST